MTPFDLIILVILIVLSAFFSGSEVALLSISNIKVKTYLKEGKRGAKALSRLKENPRRMIITILIGSNVATIAAASMAALMVTEKFGSSGLGIATGVMTLIILIFGEITPKTFAITYAGRISLAISNPLLVMSYVLYPLVILLEWISNRMIKLVKIKKLEPITEAEIKTMIDFGVEKKVIEPQEKHIMESAFKFSDISAFEIMTPFDKIFSLNGNSTIKNSFGKIVKSGFSRIPIYTNRKENITGIIFIKDVVKAVSKKEYRKKLKDLSMDPIFVSKDIFIGDLLKIFENRQTHIALVKDDDKAIGLVTHEDLLEELVGEITDESDITPGTIIRIDKNTIVAHGDTLVEKINRFLNTSLPMKSSDIKLNELILNYLKRPRRNSKVKIGQLNIILEDVRDGQILKVRIIKRSDTSIHPLSIIHAIADIMENKKSGKKDN